MSQHVCQGLRYCTRPVAGQFQVPLGQRFTVAIYVCAFTCACSFTVRSVRGFLLIALSFSVFPPFLCIPYFIRSIISRYFSTELSVQCDGCLGRGWVWWAGLVAGLWVRQALGFLLPGLEVGGSSPRFLGTRPPCETWALNCHKCQGQC